MSEIRVVKQKLIDLEQDMERLKARTHQVLQAMEDLKKEVATDLENHLVSVQHVCTGCMDQCFQVQKEDLRNALQGDIILLIEKYKHVA